jgi:hypothetical protein
VVLKPLFSSAVLHVKTMGRYHHTGMQGLYCTYTYLCGSSWGRKCVFLIAAASLT